MEHREPPRINAGDGRPRDPGRRRVPGLDPDHATRRLASSRLAAAATVGAVALALAWAVGRQATRGAFGWVHALPQYQLRFRDIALSPPPPPWIKVGREGLLEGVRTAGRWDESMSALDLDKERLRDDFRLHCPWVARVERVESAHPNKVTVVLAYREPVAFAQWASRPGRVYVDGHGVILPSAEVDEAGAQPLWEIVTTVKEHGGDAVKFAPPAPAVPGLPWRLDEPGPGGASRDRIAEMARMAGFLRERSKDDPALARSFATLFDYAPRPFYLGWVEGSYVNWGPAPGSEPAGSPDAAAKWGMIREWLRGKGPAAAYIREHREPGRPVFRFDRGQFLLDFVVDPGPGVGKTAPVDVPLTRAERLRAVPTPAPGTPAGSP